MSSRSIKITASLFCLICLVLGTDFFYFIYKASKPTPDPNQKVESIIVLTGGSVRLRHSLNLFAKSGAQRLLMSGVNKQIDKEDIIKHHAQYESIFQCCVDLGYDAQNTYGNALEAQKWLAKNKYDSAFIVTSNYHMPRAMYEMKNTISDVMLVPAPVIPDNFEASDWPFSLRALQILTSEYIKYLAARFRI